MADSRSTPAPAPSQARIYDYLLGGDNNLPADREVADALIAHSMRFRMGIERFFAGFDLIPPGLVLVTDWRPDGQQPTSDYPPAMFGAVGRLHASAYVDTKHSSA